MAVNLKEFNNVSAEVFNALTTSEKRSETYIHAVEQLDQLYHDMTAGKLDATGEWHKAIKAVKDAYPK
jgi:hypothetical protein